MFWPKRRSSRPELYNTTNKNQIQQQLPYSPRRPSLSENSSPRQPLLPLNPLNPQASQSSLAAADEMSLSPHMMSNADSAAIKHAISRQIVNRDALDSQHGPSTASTQVSRRPQPDQGRRNSVPSLNSPSPNHNSASPTASAVDPLGEDLYTYNSLSSFSFGSVQPQASSSCSRPVNPLSSARDDPDNRSEEFAIPADVTPRPSVVAYHHLGENQNFVSSHPAQSQGWFPPMSPSHPRVRPRPSVDRDRDRAHRERDSDVASHHTFGTSSASASVTSLSDMSASFSRTDSRASRHTNTTNQTSAHDLSSTDDEEDHHHPIPPHLSESSNMSTTVAGSSGTGTAVEFSSDEEYEASEYDYDDYYDDDSMNIEISSAQYEGSVAAPVDVDWEREFYSFGGGGSGSVRGYPAISERRGSLPMAIPGANAAPSGGSDAFFPTGRDREGSLATLRRPSRSLDDEFRALGLIGGRGPSHTDGSNVSGVDPSNRPPAPVSVPESDGDWRSLQERSMMKGKGREKDPLSATSGLDMSGNVSSIPPLGGASAMEEFDLDWSDMRGGITSLDHSAVADIIRPTTTPNDHRPSAGNSRWLPQWGVINTRRPSTATVASYYVNDSFGKAVGKWGGDIYQAQRRDWSFRREKADSGTVVPRDALGRRTSNTATFMGPRGSMMTERSVVPSSIVEDQERDPEKDKASKSAAWKGMAIGSQEIWKNDLVGRFKVNRQSTMPSDPAKGPQQRLVVTHFRDPYILIPIPHDGPPVTIHKHSKAVAFSISRHYKMRPPPNTSRGQSHASAHRQDSGSGVNHNQPHLNIVFNALGVPQPPTKKSSSMILLAPRRVQVSFTSTNTTRKLESHGLLDEGLGMHNDSKDKERAKRHKERQKEKEREKRRKGEESKNKGKGKQIKDDNHVGTSSAGSITSGTTLITPTLRPPPSSAPSLLHTYPPSSTASLNSASSSSSRDPTLDNHSISRNPSNHSRRRRRVRDPLDVSDDDDDLEPRPTRTPHSEAYGTVDPSQLEQMRPRQDRSHISDFSTNKSFLKNLIRGRNAHPAPGPSSGQIPSNFEPPWMTMASRNKQEQQQRVVDNLNTSFKDVGLLPSTHKDKPKRSPSIPQKQKKIASGNANAVDIFEDVPPESLYMLLPLWPGNTDPASERKAPSFQKPVLPNEMRQYLLVYYKAEPDPLLEEKPPEGETKKRSRNSPTSSADSQTKERTSILLSTFHISARLVSYKDLQGSGVRVPDEGLTITGPLEAAYRTMPSAVRESGLYEFVLGICHSRDAGIEFYPDGLIKMGLCTSSPVDERPRPEEEMPPDPEVALTPLGRAVLEMSWLGAMALTSFGPGA